MSTGNWDYSYQYINGEPVYQVYRLRDVNAIDCGGNREYKGGFFSTKEEAQAYATKLNAQPSN